MNPAAETPSKPVTPLIEVLHTPDCPHVEAARAEGEELFAVAIRNGGGVLGVVSLAAPTEHAADIASEAAHQAAWLAAAALSRILSNYGVPAR